MTVEEIQPGRYVCLEVRDSRETLEAMRALHSDVVTVLSSGYDETEATFRLQGNGRSGFIQKPYLPRALASKIKELLRQ